ncbi:MAG TPA: hypothetical protein VEC12_06620 [Bacteroidia bacterium]|nr:hypothetical protein [Bacteroidia bacterium]
MNKIICLLLTVCLATIACENKKDPSIFTGDGTGKVGFTDSSFIKVVDGFYNWYIIENYVGPGSFSSAPATVKITDSLYQLDVEGHIKVLKNTGFFTKRFIEYERKLVEECNQRIIENKWMDDSELDFSGCDYFSYDRWLGGQGEDIDGHEIVAVGLQGEKRTVEVSILIDGKNFSTARVFTVPENGTYKIDAINLSVGQ